MAVPIEQILQDLAVIMIIASAMTLVFYKLKQPIVIGFIIAGVIIGPHTPPFSLIHNDEVLNLFAELGVILLLFTVGMEFPIQKLRNIGRKAIIIATTEAFGTLSIGFFVAQALGLGFYDSLFISFVNFSNKHSYCDEGIGRAQHDERRISHLNSGNRHH